MIPGDRVRGVAPWFSFCGRGGVVVSVEPLYVLFDGEREPYCVSEREIASDTLRPPPLDDVLESGVHLGGAE